MGIRNPLSLEAPWMLKANTTMSEAPEKVTDGCLSVQFFLYCSYVRMR